MDPANSNNTQQTNSDQSTKSEEILELEFLTSQFIAGKITLSEYNKKVRELRLTRLDLRKVASKITPAHDSDNSRK